MKFKIVFYLFIFVCILLFFQLFNTNKVLNYQDDLIQKQNQAYIRLKDSIKVLKEYRDSNIYFSLVKDFSPKKDNGSADLKSIEDQITTALRTFNTNGALKNILPEITKKGTFLIDQIKVVNQQWVLIGFKSNSIEGQAILKYTVAKDNSIQFEILTHFLDPL